jgi:prophage antirepressor-like protein
MTGITMIEKFWFDRDEIDGYAELETNEPWFHAGQVCKVLNLTNPTESLRIHTDEDERRKVDGKVLGKLQDTWYVSESGLYGLILAAKTDKAKSFKRWLKREVLPSIRRSRVYISPDATSADIISAAQDRGISLALELNDQQALLTYNAQLQNRCVDFDGLEQEWLSVSQILEKRGYKLKSKAVDVSLSQIGKTIKKDYIEATGKEPKLTVKQVGQNHGTEIKSYPADWYDRIEQTAITYWTKKGLIDIVK